MARFNIQPQRVNPRDARNQNDMLQQQLDQQGQNSMVDQLSKLYGISSDQAMQPGKQAQMEASTRHTNAAAAGQEFENQWAQPNAEAMYNLHGAQADMLSGKTANQSHIITPEDYMRYKMQTGRDMMDDVPPELHSSMFPPAMVEAHAAKTAAAEHARQAAIAADQSQQQQATPGPTYGSEARQAVTGGIGDFLGTVGRHVVSPLAFPFRAYNAGAHTPVGQEIPDIPFVPERGDFWGTNQPQQLPDVVRSFQPKKFKP